MLGVSIDVICEQYSIAFSELSTTARFSCLPQLQAHMHFELPLVGGRVVE